MTIVVISILIFLLFTQMVHFKDTPQPPKPRPLQKEVFVLTDIWGSVILLKDSSKYKALTTGYGFQKHLYYDQTEIDETLNEHRRKYDTNTELILQRAIKISSYLVVQSVPVYIVNITPETSTYEYSNLSGTRYVQLEQAIKAIEEEFAYLT